MAEPVEDVVKTDLLIVGAGPAGASLACFLAAHRKRGIIIAAAPGTAETPRAHITNMAGLECLRDINLEEPCLRLATPSSNMRHTRWCKSMAGEEYGRVHSWGHDPWYKGAYEAASPCQHVDLPQTLLEPILTRQAVNAGWTLRFNTKLVSLSGPDGKGGIVTCEVQDEVTGRKYKIQSQYVFGCDGARSQVVREIGLPLIKKPGQGLALNVLVKADLTHLVEPDLRVGNLHWVFRPDEPTKESPPWGWAAVVRMVKPWNEWMFIFLPRPGMDLRGEDMDASEEGYLKRVKQFIGDDSVKAEVVHTSKWWINEIVAERYDDEGQNVFCLGDAVHRHPPFNGLGSNTCIQDAYNLAWKVAYVMEHRAGRELLSSYSVERQPVGVDIITRANQGLRDHIPWQQALGMLEEDEDKRAEILAEFDDLGEKGRKRRQLFQKAIEGTTTEFHGLGIEMNQMYTSDAVYLDDETGPPPALPEDRVRTHVVTTYPGRRLPHVWLNTRVPSFKLSTIDLAGHQKFCLFTGPGGQKWKEAAKIVEEKLSVGILAYSIGWKQDYEDVYFDWARKREVEEDGCVLVRPDRFVAWRSKTLIPDAAERLEDVLRKILWR
ncbi:phenol 2-monooxygenase [Podospora australis]|uniref:Phenol 2-monooxygenase n=1 Tax=Podospora australis TaxID=1536484 RepID=A0AAN6WMA3_9PEZI|nr:phenol 2-monooxygenase [Podospora australis]